MVTLYNMNLTILITLFKLIHHQPIPLIACDLTEVDIIEIEKAFKAGASTYR